MAMTRRQFLKRAGVAAAGTVVAPSLFGNPFVRKAFADTIGDRYLVVLFLDGGNDGLNTVIPIDNVGGLRTAYEGFRSGGSGGLRINSGEMSVPSVVPLTDPNTGTALGFHPGLAALTTMYDAGNVAVIQGTGYPDYSLSHDTSQTIWQTANPTGMAPNPALGWVGRHLAHASAAYGPLDIPAVTIENSIAGDLRTTGTSVLAIRRLRRFGFPYDASEEEAYEELLELDIAAKEEAYGDLYLSAGLNAEPTTSLVGNAGQATLVSTQSYPGLESLYNDDPARKAFGDAYGAQNTSTARDLREIAKIINGVRQATPGVNARFFQLDNGGYDTHSNQGATTGQHFNLHAEVANALNLFYQDLADMGVADKVTTVVWSEFSRRIPQNSNGTDHGSQGPMFVIGESVNGGIYGNHPNIDPLALDTRENTVYSQDPLDDFRSTDFRDVFGTILKNWVNMAEVDILADVMPLDVGLPTEYWTVHDFDMGFL